MKKLFILFLLPLFSCISIDRAGCVRVLEYDRNLAKSYYESWGVSVVDSETYDRVKKKFVCNYYTGDYIYSYKTFLNTKYILVHDGEAVTYIEE
jgi:hypothetical protein